MLQSFKKLNPWFLGILWVLLTFVRGKIVFHEHELQTLVLTSFCDFFRMRNPEEKLEYGADSIIDDIR